MSAPAAPAATTAPQMTHRQTVQALFSLLVAVFNATLSSTVVSTALPQIIGDVKGSQTQYTWVVTATLLTATASTPLWGKLADLYSKKTMIQAATVIFVLGSIAAGVSQTGGQLIAARAVQGLGVGGLQALVQIAIGAMIPPRDRGRYAGYQSGVTAVATIGGPLLGGLLVDTDWLGWRWCFWIGIPIGALALIMLHLTLRLPVIRRASVKIDYLGATLITAGVSVLLVWISFVDGSFAWLSWQTAAMVGGSLALLVAALVVEARVDEPIVPLHILRQRTVALAICGSLAAGTAMFGASVFLSQYWQLSRGFTPLESGLLSIPMMVGVLVSSLVGGNLLSRVGRVRPFILFGSVLLTAGFSGLSLIDHATPIVFIGAAMACIGVGIGTTMQNFTLAVQNAVALRDIGAASSTISFFRSLGGTIGVSVLGAVLARRVSGDVGHELATRGIHAAGVDGGNAGSLLQAGVLPPEVDTIVRTVYGDATGSVFLISAGVAFLGLLAALLMRPVVLRTSLDLADEVQSAAVAAGVADGAPVGDLPAAEPTDAAHTGRGVTG